MKLLTFVVVPALKNKSANFVKVLLMGAVFGLIAYSTYDLTNYATIKDWPLALTIVDMLWGYTLSGTVAALSFAIGKRYL